MNFQQVVRDIQEEGVLKGKASIEIAAKRILKKSEKYNQQYFKWWELLICMGIGYLAFMVPYGLLRFQKQIMLLNMEDEVIQFNTMILMLMHIERISVEDILVHMEMLALVFKESISKCINNFEYGDYEALEQLKVDEPFLPLIRIVENLQAATDRISISKAFDALKSDRLYYKDKRKQDNEIIVDKKGLWGKVIAFTPFTLALVLYLLV